MNELICPICKAPLHREGGSLYCSGEQGRRHCFDIAKSGYVTLTGASGSSGDSREMVRARTEFLDSGAYRPFADAVLSALDGVERGVIVDAGCGEGYYTNLIASELKSSAVFGFDLSKFACERAAKRAKAAGNGAFFAAASLFELPMADGSCDAVVNLFAPTAESEFARILKPGGLLVIGAAGKRHLYELKRAVYDEVYENEGRRDLPHELFEKLGERKVSYSFVCEGDKLQSLFSMTPYAFKTSREDRAKLDLLRRLEITADFDIFIYKKEVEV